MLLALHPPTSTSIYHFLLSPPQQRYSAPLYLRSQSPTFVTMQAVSYATVASVQVCDRGVVAESTSSCYVHIGSAKRSAPMASLGCSTTASEFAKNALFGKASGSGRRSGSRAVVSMAKSTAAAGYAAALIELGKSAGTLEAIHSDIENLSNLMNNKELADYISNPTVEDLKKKQILKTLSKDASFNAQTSDFLNLLVDKRRANIVQSIALAFEEMYCEVTDTQVAVVTSAVKLENSQQALIAKKLQSMTGAKNIKLKNIVNTTLIAGFIVQYGKDGSREIDMSVKGQLDSLAAKFEYAEKTVSA